MATTLKEIVITGFEIFNTVGRRGTNDPDDTLTIKQLLNGISSTDGGAANTLDPKDTSAIGPEFDRLVEAIEIFQARHFRGVFAPDGVISPNKKTHKKLQEKFFQERDRKRTIFPKLPVLVRPADSLLTLSNESGFSAEGLVKSGNGEWNIRNPLAPPTQMVPMGETRRLILTLVPGSDLNSTRLGTQILDPGIATLVGNEDLAVTIRGTSPGITSLVISARGQTSEVKIMVRMRRQIAVSLTVVGAIMNQGQATALQSSIVQQLNRIFQPQSNFTFNDAGARVVTTVRSQSRNVDVNIDPAQRVFFDDKNFLAPNAFAPQVLHGRDLLAIDPGASNQLRLFIGNMVDAADPVGTFGSAFAGIGNKACWFRADQTGRVAKNSFGTIAHESGHAVGLFHINSAPNARFLMFPNDTAQDNNLIIPAETTIDLGAP